MKTSIIFTLFVAIVSAADLHKRSCSAQCVEKVVQASGCAKNDLSCSCSKPGLIKQLQPCLEFACGTAGTLDKAKVAFTQKCQAAGVEVRFADEKVQHWEMAKRSSPSATASGQGIGHKAAATTTRGAKPAMYTGAASPRDVAGSMLGLVAAVAAAAAI